MHVHLLLLLLLLDALLCVLMGLLCGVRTVTDLEAAQARYSQ
jgi:hypothetical protein